MRTRVLTTLMGATFIAAAGLMTAASPASGTGDPFEEFQSKVSYTVYEPSYTAGLPRTPGRMAQPCGSDLDEFLYVGYGRGSTSRFGLQEGNPICADSGGIGKQFGPVRVHGVKAILLVFCDYTDAQQWRDCSRSDMTRFGGSLSFTLPASGGRQATDILLVTDGTGPLSASTLIRIARGLMQVDG